MKQKNSRPKPPMVRLSKLRWTDNNIRLIIIACYNDLIDLISNIRKRCRSIIRTRTMHMRLTTITVAMNKNEFDNNM